MKYIRPLDPESVEPGHSGPWLIAPDEGAGCAIRIRRGGAAPAEGERAVTPDKERFALVLEGEAQLLGGMEGRARPGELIFIPAGANGQVRGADSTLWAEVEAPVAGAPVAADWQARVIPIDQSRFEGSGFAHQSLIDRSGGATSARMNVLQVQPGSGSPDFHIHAFAQIYLIQEGEMTLDIGTRRMAAPAGTLVYLPAGVVHRNFNASSAVERHVSFLVPEPQDGEIFDFAVTIHEHEAELLTAIPASHVR